MGLRIQQNLVVVLKTIQSNPATYEWIKNYWVHLVVIDPSTKSFLRFKDEGFIRYQPESQIEHLDHLRDKLLSTKENLPVYLIDSL